MRRNITRMAEAAAAGGKRLRPHGKTHKSGWIAREQIAAGAVGMTCAKPAEAEVFAAAEVQDIRIAYPISPTYAPRILSLMDGVRISTIVDDLEVAAGLVRRDGGGGAPARGARQDRRRDPSLRRRPAATRRHRFHRAGERHAGTRPARPAQPRGPFLRGGVGRGDCRHRPGRGRHDGRARRGMPRARRRTRGSERRLDADRRW